MFACHYFLTCWTCEFNNTYNSYFVWAYLFSCMHKYLLRWIIDERLYPVLVFIWLSKLKIFLILLAFLNSLVHILIRICFCQWFNANLQEINVYCFTVHNVKIGALMKKKIVEHKSNSQRAIYTECCTFQINNDRVVCKKCTPLINIVKWVYVFDPQVIVRFAHLIIFHGSLLLRSLRRNQPDRRGFQIFYYQFSSLNERNIWGPWLQNTVF